jgi:hypothetical protein
VQQSAEGSGAGQNQQAFEMGFSKLHAAQQGSGIREALSFYADNQLTL